MVIFSVPIVIAKKTTGFQFHPDAPTLEYQKRDQNGFCFISLAYPFVVSKELVAEKSIETRITEFMSYKSHDYTDRIKLAN